MRHSVTPVVLMTVFAGVYFALGPGCFFSVDEVVVEQMARAVYQRGNLEVPAIDTAIRGEGGAYYAHRGPALGYVAAPFVAIGRVLDNRVGSFNGGTATGPPQGTLEHPLRWGGRFSIFTALIANALIGGLAVAVLYLIALNMNAAHGVALAFSIAAGVATLLASESTHFFQHPLEAVCLLCGFWFLSEHKGQPISFAWLGGLSLGLAVLARPNAAPAAAVIWIYGAMLSRERTRTLLRSAAGPAACAVLYMLYNSVQYGGLLETGYGDEEGIFRWTLAGPVQAVIAYLFSPTLSIFLFAPPLILIPFVWKQSRLRWPRETMCLLLASACHFAVIAFLPQWDGAISYGPRYALAPMLLLMPLTIPAFEKAFQERKWKWRNAVILLILIGALVQIIGMSVYVVTNEWYYHQHNIYEGRKFVFTLAASPVWLHLQDMFAGRNIIPWALRAIAAPGAPLLLLMMLGLGVAAGCGLLWVSQSPKRVSSVPAVSVTVISVLILLGFFAAAPITAPPEVRAADYVRAGKAAQEVGRDVEAEELYALVLGLYPGNEFALNNLGLLYEKAGKTAEALALHERARRSDQCTAPGDCYQAGRLSWDKGDKTEALRVWEQAAQRFPFEVSLIRSVARARYDLADYGGAIRDYRRALELSPSHRAIRTDLAWALLAVSQFEEARRICEEVLAEDPGNAAARAILARLP